MSAEMKFAVPANAKVWTGEAPIEITPDHAGRDWSGHVAPVPFPPTPAEGERAVWRSGAWYVEALSESVEIEPPRPRPQMVTAYRLLFELLQPLQQLVLDAAVLEANTILTPAAMLDPAADDRTKALIIIRNGRERIDKRGDAAFPLDTPQMRTFLAAARTLKVFGQDVTPEEQSLADLEIGRILENKSPTSSAPE